VTNAASLVPSGCSIFDYGEYRENKFEKEEEPNGRKKKRDQ
jgi:hypothetical protein